MSQHYLRRRHPSPRVRPSDTVDCWTTLPHADQSWPTQRTLVRCCCLPQILPSLESPRAGQTGLGVFGAKAPRIPSQRHATDPRRNVIVTEEGRGRHQSCSHLCLADRYMWSWSGGQRWGGRNILSVGFSQHRCHADLPTRWPPRRRPSAARILAVRGITCKSAKSPLPLC